MSRSITIPRIDPPSLLTLFSYLTLLHILYLIWRERSGGESNRGEGPE